MASYFASKISSSWEFPPPPHYLRCYSCELKEITCYFALHATNVTSFTRAFYACVSDQLTQKLKFIYGIEDAKNVRLYGNFGSEMHEISKMSATLQDEGLFSNQQITIEVRGRLILNCYYL